MVVSDELDDSTDVGIVLRDEGGRVPLDFELVVAIERFSSEPLEAPAAMAAAVRVVFIRFTPSTKRTKRLLLSSTSDS